VRTKEKAEKIFQILREDNPNPATELNFDNSFQLAVAVILSAQCTDKRVNSITPSLFKKFPNAEKMSNSSEKEIFEYIKSVSYPNSKASYIFRFSNIIAEKYNGEIPNNFNKLVELPGIGRKSANVLLSVLYNKPVMPVDTHIHRLASRIGLAKNAKNVLQTEKQLLKNIPKDFLKDAHHWLILHGRYVCTAKKPKCNLCKIREYCDWYNSKLL